MKKRLLFLIVFALILSSCAPVAEFSADKSIWLCGYAERELIPSDPKEHKYYVAGYKNENSATGVLDYQKVKAVYLEAGGGAAVYLAVDCVGLSSESVESIRKEAKLPRGISLHVISTHTHAGIDTLGLWGPVAVDGKDEEFDKLLIQKAGEAARESYSVRSRGKLFYGSGSYSIESLQEDSRSPQVYDKRLHQLRFEAESGNGVRIFDYAAHAESLRGDNTLISADYPAYLCDAIKRETGDDAVYLPGAIGGLIMTKVLTDGSGKELPAAENAVATGERLAEAALSIDNERELAPILLQAEAEVEIPLDNKLFVAMGALGILTNDIISSGEGEYGLSVKTKVSLTKIGDMYILFLPGEIFPELVYSSGAETGVRATVKEIIDENFIVVGLCDDEIGYIIPPKDFLLNEDNPYLDRIKDENGEDHYEETNSVGPLAAERLLSAVETLYARLSG